MEQVAGSNGLPGADPGKLNQFTLDVEKDKPRGRGLVKMRVLNRGTLGLQIQRNLIGIGQHDVIVYDDEVKHVAALVEDPELLKRADEQYRNDIAEEVAERYENWTGTPADMRALIEAGSHQKVNEIYARVLTTTGKSPQAAFQRLFKRSPLPLDKAELLPNSDMPEPQRQQLARETQKTADALASALETALLNVAAKLGLAGGADVKALVKAELEEQLGGSKPGKGGK